jgi:small GTP-binding protein
MASEDAVPLCKVVVVGNSGVGKTSLISQWISTKFEQFRNPTIGTYHQRKRVVLEGTGPVDLWVWDTAGQEQFHSLVPLYSRSANLAIVTAGIDDANSFASIPEWIDIVTSSCEQTPPMILAVNKTDLKEKAKMSPDEIQEKFGARFLGLFFVSALTGENVDPLFSCVAVEAYRFFAKLAESGPSQRLQANDGDGPCC